MKLKIELTIIIGLICNQIFASTEGQKQIVIGVAFVLLIILFVSLKDFISKDRKAEKFEIEQRSFKLKIGEIEALKRNGIIDEDEMNLKVQEVESQRKEKMINYYLLKNSKYKPLNDALEKGYISKDKYDEKISELKESISSDIK